VENRNVPNFHKNSSKGYPEGEVMNKLKKILIGVAVAGMLLGLQLYFSFPVVKDWPLILFLIASALIISGIAIFSYKNVIIKILDFLYQAIFITWIFGGIFSGKMTGQGFIGALVLGEFIKPYQFLSSITIVTRQFLKNEINRTGLFRLVLCIATAGLLLLLFVANRNCWSLQDILTFSNQEVADYKSYYALHKSEPFVHPLCEHLIASNNIFVRNEISIFCLIPFFFILTIIERVADIVRIIKKK
jgi:hypothetical protein